MPELSNEEVMELEFLKTEMKFVRPSAKVERLPSHYGYEIFDPEWTIVALVSWGQDGSARLAMATTAIDGGWWGLESPMICNYNCGHRNNIRELASSIAREVSDFVNERMSTLHPFKGEDKPKHP